MGKLVSNHAMPKTNNSPPLNRLHLAWDIGRLPASGRITTFEESPLDLQLPDDRQSLEWMVRSLLAEREREKQRDHEYVLAAVKEWLFWRTRMGQAAAR